ncbi:MAG: UMP kinase [Planctomycetota bacterium]|jgi:uridylate kinase
MSAESDDGWKRILLKISGESFCPENSHGIDIESIALIADETIAVHAAERELAIVCGGGNFIRGAEFAKAGMNRATADYMGMMATILNALALQDALEKKGVETRVLTAIEIPEVAEPFIRRRAIRHLVKGRIVILAGGTGNPYFTTDTAAALRATELGCEVLLKGTKVDGVFDRDPVRDRTAKFYRQLTFMDVLRSQLKVIDATAASLCEENNIPVRVFNMLVPGNIREAALGGQIGTLIVPGNAKENKND